DSTSAVNSEDGSNHEPLNAAEQESFIRKINWRIIPLLFLSYMFMGIDKSNISNGRIYGLEKDLGMISGQFAWVVSIFYFGYLLFMLPLTLLFRRSLRPSIWLAVIIISSGVTASCMTFSQSFGSLMVLRFLLGCAESGFGPSMTYFISQWYTRKEHARTFARYYSASQIGGIIKGFAAYGVGFIGKGVDGKGWSPWRWLFLVEGLPTLVIGVLIMFVLPNYPNNTKILTERERQYAVQRIKDDLKQQQQGNGTDNDAAFSTGQILRAEVWAAISSGFSVALQLYGFCLGIINASFSAYMPTIIRSMGYGSLETQLLTIPQYIVGLIALNVVAEVSDRQGKRARYAI
ncbi:MFS general substrate transporter, partial [Ramicandelaber brevisporus]